MKQRPGISQRDIAIHNAREAYWLLSRHGRNSGLTLVSSKDVDGEEDRWLWVDFNGFNVSLTLGGKLRYAKRME